jgi:hypothetical protein
MRPSVAVVVALGLLAIPLRAEPGEAGRDELAALAQGLEAVAARVSVASPGFLGSPPTRAYRVPGVGVVVVLAPRLLGGASGHARLVLPLASPSAPRSVAASRADLERAILDLRTSLERASTAPAPSALAVAEGDLRSLERHAEERLAAAARARAEAFRALAEAMSTLPSAPRTALLPATATASTARPRPADPRSPSRAEDVVTRVRAALRDALPDAIGAAAQLPETESISVAVDFVAPGSWPGSAAQRTLVVRGRIGDLRAAQAGQRPLAELPLEILEY